MFGVFRQSGLNRSTATGQHAETHAPASLASATLRAEKITQEELLLAALLVLAAAVGRLCFQAWPNFHPLHAIAVLAGWQLTARKASAAGWGRFLLAAAVPAIGLALSNVWLPGYHNWLVPLSVYGSLAAVPALPFLLQRLGVDWQGMSAFAGGAACCLIPACWFFLVTNLAVWLSHPEMYTTNLSGLLQCYAAGVPFFRSNLLGDLLFVPSAALLWSLGRMAMQVGKAQLARVRKQG